jgi:hypothetical protein
VEDHHLTVAGEVAASERVISEARASGERRLDHGAAFYPVSGASERGVDLGLEKKTPD